MLPLSCSLLAVSLAIATTKASSGLAPRDPPTTYGPWTSLGCWNDNNINRTLHVAMGSSPTNTVETCLDTCFAAGFALGGVEFGSECYCGNAILYNYGGPLASGCDIACSGHPGEICGGAGTINIYHNGNLDYTVGPAAPVSSYEGYHGFSNDVFGGLCYSDVIWTVGGPRLLRFHPNTPIPAENMTVEKCIDGCKASLYRAAALEFGQECWCEYAPGQPMKLPIGDNRPVSECGMPCTGNATEFCGGPERAIVYTM